MVFGPESPATEGNRETQKGKEEDGCEGVWRGGGEKKGERSFLSSLPPTGGPLDDVSRPRAVYSLRLPYYHDSCCGREVGRGQRFLGFRQEFRFKVSSTFSRRDRRLFLDLSFFGLKVVLSPFHLPSFLKGCSSKIELHDPTGTDPLTPCHPISRK